MGCDGIWEKKSNEEMVEWVYKQIDNKKSNCDIKQIISDLLQKECLSENHTESGKLILKK